jgi:hypothetical protein
MGPIPGTEHDTSSGQYCCHNTEACSQERTMAASAASMSSSISATPRQGVDVEPARPIAKPAAGRGPYPFGAPLGTLVAAVHGHDVGDGVDMALDGGPRWAHRRRTALGDTMAAAGPPHIGERLRGQGPQPALAAVRGHGGDMAAAQRPAQTDLAEADRRGLGHAQDVLAVGQHVGVEASVLFAPTIALRSRAESWSATNPIRQPASPTATDNASHVPPVGLATTRLPAYRRSRSVNALMPAKVGGTLKSSFTPSPRTATWCVATTAASMPIDTLRVSVLLPLSSAIEGSPFDQTGRPRSATPANLGDLEQPRT